MAYILSSIVNNITCTIYSYIYTYSSENISSSFSDFTSLPIKFFSLEVNSLLIENFINIIWKFNGHKFREKQSKLKTDNEYEKH